MDRIRHARRRLGLSQEELAEASGVSAATIVQVELGNRRPQGRTLRKLAAALGVEVADLLEEEDASPKAQSRSSLEPKLFNGIDGERHLRFLRAWRAFVHLMADRWEERAPTAREIATLLDTLTALEEQEVFDVAAADPSEKMDLRYFMDGLETLNSIADSVEKDEEAKQRRAKFALIQEKSA